MSMSGYTKLFSSILTSSIWGEADHTRIVWITLLALADRNGDVSASTGGLARSANLDRARCEEAIKVLASPDPDDRSGVKDGIRIEPIQGGWHIVNYAAYREKMRAVDRTEYLREKQRQHRAKRQQLVNKSTIVNQSQPIASASSEASTPTAKKLSSPAASELDLDLPDEPVSTTPKPLSTAEREFEDLWSICEKRQGKGSALKAYLKARKSGQMPDIGTVKAAYCRMAESWDWTKEDRQYHPLLATWLNRQGWTDVPRGGGPPQTGLKMIFPVKNHRTPEEEARLNEGAEMPED